MIVSPLPSNVRCQAPSERLSDRALVDLEHASQLVGH